MSFKNDGTGPAHVKLSERGGSFQILQPGGCEADQHPPRGGGSATPEFLGNHEHGDVPGVDAGAPKDPTWSQIANYPARRSWTTPPTSSTGRSTRVGGVDGSFTLLNKGYVYNPGDNTWTPIANMANAREKPGVAAVNGKLYVTGGWDSNGNPIAATEAYDPGSDTWSTVAPNPSPTAAPGVAVANGKIYFVGGCADGSARPRARSRSTTPSTDSWSSAADYPTGDSW